MLNVFIWSSFIFLLGLCIGAEFLSKTEPLNEDKTSENFDKMLRILVDCRFNSPNCTSWEQAVRDTRKLLGIKDE